MNHEPECWFQPQEVYGVDDIDCICSQLRTAYQRGRYDAASDVRSLAPVDFNPAIDQGKVWQEDAVTAARGDGEQP